MKKVERVGGYGVGWLDVWFAVGDGTGGGQVACGHHFGAEDGDAGPK